jgi:DNA polymerase-3 subunit epsilon
VLYVGKATDLRSRVRSYFSGETRRKVAQLLREVERIDHCVCGNTLEAAVLEVRLIHEHLPPFNRQAKLWRRYAYLKLTLDERWPRLSIVKVPKPHDGCLYIGPLASQAAARLVADAIEMAAPLRRCTLRPGREPRNWPCVPAQLGVAACPCAGTISDAGYGAVVERVARGLTVEPALLLEPLEARMNALAAAERFEEAADVRDAAAALARALHRQRRLDGLRRAGRVEVAGPDGHDSVLDRGRLLRTGTLFDVAESVDPEAPLPRHLADELNCVGAWLDAEAGRLRLLHCDGELASPLPRLPRFEPREAGP